MKTAMWIYLFMFVALFDLHAQYPILSPFALSLGAAPSFIGLIMGMYSITHIPGNLIAGVGVDRYGSKIFIAGSLIAAGVLLLWQSQIEHPWQLLVIRSISGFVLAFLSPACMSLLASLARNSLQQGHLMSGNGMVHTVASIVSPAAGALMVAKIGFSAAFVLLGAGLIIIGVMACLFIRDVQTGPADNIGGHSPAGGTDRSFGIPWRFYALPLALSLTQGILFFELPLIPDQTLMASGLLFSIVSIGSLCTLSLLFLNRYSPASRNIWGSLGLAVTFFGMAVGWPLPLEMFLLMIGMCQGVIYPALGTYLTSVSGRGQYGKVFALLSISFSIGAFLGPVLSGQLRDHISPYYAAFLTLMLALALFPTGNRVAPFPLIKRQEER